MYGEGGGSRSPNVSALSMHYQGPVCKKAGALQVPNLSLEAGINGTTKFSKLRQPQMRMSNKICRSIYSGCQT